MRPAPDSSPGQCAWFNHLSGGLVAIESNDAMKFNVAEIVVDKRCQTFTVNLKHVGKLPKTGEDYTFFCSMSGHSGLMKGKLKF